MLLGLITLSDAWARCGPAKTCRCIASTGVVSCREAGLRRMPQIAYDLSRGYRTLDLRGNEIRSLEGFDASRYESVDLRNNPLICTDMPGNVRHAPCYTPTPETTTQQRPARDSATAKEPGSLTIILSGTCGVGGALLTLMAAAVAWLYRHGRVPRLLMCRSINQAVSEMRGGSEDSWSESDVAQRMVVSSSTESAETSHE